MRQRKWEWVIVCYMDGEWDVSGEGPFDTRGQAYDFAYAEVGVPYVLLRVPRVPIGSDGHVWKTVSLEGKIGVTQ
jgi:hypothetical protein